MFRVLVLCWYVSRRDSSDSSSFRPFCGFCCILGRVIWMSMGGDGFQTQRRKSWVPGKIRAEKVLADDMRGAGRPTGDEIDKSVLNPETSMFESGQFYLGQVTLSPILSFDSGETKTRLGSTHFSPKTQFLDVGQLWPLIQKSPPPRL